MWLGEILTLLLVLKIINDILVWLSGWKTRKLVREATAKKNARDNAIRAYRVM